MMRIILIITLMFSLTACAGFQGPESSSKREVNNYKNDVRKIAQGKNVKVYDTSYLGAKVIYKETSNYPPEFKKKVEIRASGTLIDLVEQVRDIARVNFRVEKEQAQSGDAPPVMGGGLPEMGSPPGMSAAAPTYGAIDDLRLSVYYSGDIEGYFHMLSNKFGAEWTHDNEKRLVEFHLNSTKTFAVLAMPGDTSYKNTISNSASSSGTSGAEGATGGDTGAESSQTSSSLYTGNFWTGLTESVTTMLTRNGKAHCNPNTGTVTVTDTPKVVRSVEKYITQLNQTLGRQVAYEVRVLALQTSDSGEVGFDLNAVFKSGDLAIATTPVNAINALEGTGSVAAKLLSGKGQGSTAIVSALKQWGDVSQITSASGFAMHNTPTPVQVGGETGYVSSAATTLDGSGNTTATIETSKVPEGFYMTVVPNILEDNNVLLQYNVSLTNIESIETFEAAEDTKVQLPEVSSRSFSQKVRMKMGQTLVLGGFEQTVLSDNKGYGIFGGGSTRQAQKRIIVIIISIDSAGE